MNYVKKKPYIKKTKAKVFDVFTETTRYQVCSCDIKALLDALRRNGCENYRVETFEVPL